MPPTSLNPLNLVAEQEAGIVSKIRILCLHGYHGSANILRQQMNPLSESVRSIVEFTVVDAPTIASGDFGWWHGTFPSSNGQFRNWELTRSWTNDLFRNQGPFDGVFGFSQGAALTGLLTGLRASDEKVSDETPIAFDFAIMVGGFLSAEPEHQKLYAATDRYRIPSIHVIGTSDYVVPSTESRELAARFEAPEIIEHPGGHVIPALPVVQEKVTAFVTDMADRATAATRSRSV